MTWDEAVGLAMVARQWLDAAALPYAAEAAHENDGRGNQWCYIAIHQREDGEWNPDAVRIFSWREWEMWRLSVMDEA